MKASDRQVGGNHYKDFPIQPGEFCVKNKLRGFQQSIVGRICRYDKPTGKGLEDLEKIKHEVDLIIEWEGWGEEKHWKAFVGQKPIGINFPKLQPCECGETPYLNWGNGSYWAECPKCHTTGIKSDTQHGAQVYWNKGRGIHGTGI